MENCGYNMMVLRMALLGNYTEDGIAGELEEASIPPNDIVLGFRSPKIRQYTGYAVA